ncbi:H-NS family nucleoid-associated regulatory protein [Paraburkholderia sp. EG287A]|uniref:H-NS histone family protein n=1 Tax=unclassified Paraburkholderia TaxID=2615204 RepID=UPI0034D28C76
MAVVREAGYRELMAQREELEAKIREAQETEIPAVLEQIRKLVDDYGLHEIVQIRTVRAKSAGTARGPVEAKYADPVSGATWSGRGRAPAWIAGKDRTKLLIAG